MGLDSITPRYGACSDTQGVETKAVAPRPSMADPFVPFIVQQLDKYPGYAPVVCLRWLGSAAMRAAPITFVASCRAHRPRLLRRFNGSRRCLASR